MALSFYKEFMSYVSRLSFHSEKPMYSPEKTTAILKAVKAHKEVLKKNLSEMQVAKTTCQARFNSTDMLSLRAINNSINYIQLEIEWLSGFQKELEEKTHVSESVSD